MSTKVMGLVFESSLDRPEKFILLSLADHAKEDGSDVYPSIARIEWKTGYSERQIRSIIRNLENLKILQIVHPGGSGPADVRKYRIVISAIPMLPDFNTWKEDKGAKIAPIVRGQSATQKGGNLQHKKGAKIAPEPRTINQEQEPNPLTPTLVNPPSAQEQRPECAIDSYMAARAYCELAGFNGNQNLYIAKQAMETWKRRNVDKPYDFAHEQVLALWREYDGMEIHGKVSMKTFLGELGRFLDSDSWKKKPKESEPPKAASGFKPATPTPAWAFRK